MSIGAATELPLISRVSDDAGLERLAPEWDELLADSDAASVFLSWSWISSWRRTLGREHELRVVIARRPDDGRLLGIAPFAVERRGRRLLRHRALVLAGSGPAAPDHLDLVVRHGYERSIGPALWREATRSPDWDLIDLDGIGEQSLLARLALRRRGDRDDVERTSAPFLSLPATWEAYERRLGKNLRQNLRRYGRKLDREASAPVTERLVLDPDEVETTVATLGILHQQIREARGDRGAFATPMLKEFHRLAALGLNSAGRLRLHRLDVGESMIAAILCIRFGETVSFYVTGYDPAWSRFGPGRRILARAIAGAIGEGATEFDFLRGDEQYKAQWGAQNRWLLRVRRPVGPWGRILWIGRAARRLIRLTARRLLG